MSNEFDAMKIQAAMAAQAYQKGRSNQAPAAFETLYFIIDNMPDNVTGWWVLGRITGGFAKERSQFLDAEHDEEANAWYVQVSDKDVDHTTEVIANIDWTREGELVGIELLPGVGEAIDEALIKKRALPVPPIDAQTMASLQRGIAQAEAGQAKPLPWVTAQDENEGYARPGDAE